MRGAGTDRTFYKDFTAAFSFPITSCDGAENFSGSPSPSAQYLFSPIAWYGRNSTLPGGYPVSTIGGPVRFMPESGDGDRYISEIIEPGDYCIVTLNAGGAPVYFPSRSEIRHRCPADSGSRDKHAVGNVVISRPSVGAVKSGHDARCRGFVLVPACVLQSGVRVSVAAGLGKRLQSGIENTVVFLRVCIIFLTADPEAVAEVLRPHLPEHEGTLRFARLDLSRRRIAHRERLPRQNYVIKRVFPPSGLKTGPVMSPPPVVSVIRSVFCPVVVPSVTAEPPLPQDAVQKRTAASISANDFSFRCPPQK